MSTMTKPRIQSIAATRVVAWAPARGAARSAARGVAAVTGACALIDISGIAAAMQWVVSVGLEPRVAERLDGLVDQRLRWRLGLVELVLDSELLPLEAPELVERQHLYALHVAQIGGEFRDLADVV